MTAARARGSRGRPPRRNAVARKGARRVPARRRPWVCRRILVERSLQPTLAWSSDGVIAAIAGVIRDAMAGDAEATTGDTGSRPVSG